MVNLSGTLWKPSKRNYIMQTWSYRTLFFVCFLLEMIDIDLNLFISQPMCSTMLGKVLRGAGAPEFVCFTTLSQLYTSFIANFPLKMCNIWYWNQTSHILGENTILIYLLPFGSLQKKMFLFGPFSYRRNPHPTHLFLVLRPTSKKGIFGKNF